MGQSRPSVCVITSGLNERNLRLQPWRYLYEIGRRLSDQGYGVTFVSNGDGPLGSLPIRRLASVGVPRSGRNPQLDDLLDTLQPDVIVQHIGLTSVLHQRAVRAGRGVIGMFTSPMYRPVDFMRPGLRHVLAGYRLSGLHLVGAFLPRPMLQFLLPRLLPAQIVTQTETTRQSILQCRVAPDQVRVIAPGVDPQWRDTGGGRAIRAKLGFRAQDIVVVYAGSPAPLRGLPTLIRALHLAYASESAFRLVILNRRRAGELEHESTEILREIDRLGLQPMVTIIDGFLDEHRLIEHLAAADLVALPFELVPSDAPLSILEARALGRRVVTTRVACLAELLGDDPPYLATPGDPQSLANTLLRAARDLRQPAECPRTAPRTWEAMGAEWAELVQSVADRHA